MARRPGIKLTFLSKLVIIVVGVVGMKWTSHQVRDVLKAMKPPSQSAPQSGPQTSARPQTQQTPPVTQSKPLVVGTWNLEWFGTPQRRGNIPRSPESLQAIARVITGEMRPGVMILNEINVVSAEWRGLYQLLAKEGYESVQPVNPSSDQETVLLFDTRRVKPLGVVANIPVQQVNSGLCTATPRSPILGSFVVGGFDFTLVGVHLRAQGDRGCGGEQFRDLVRRSECQNIITYLATHQPTKMVDPDIMVVGDLNVEPGDPSISPFLKANLTMLTTPEQMAPTSGRWSYRKSRYAHALDHLLISGPALRDYVPRSAEYPARFSQMNEYEISQFRRVLSDHAPLWAQFRTDLPDDDE